MGLALTNGPEEMKGETKDGFAFRVLIKDYRRAFGYFLRAWRSLAFLTCLCFALSGLAVFQPWPLKLLIDTALGPGETPAWIATIGLEVSDSRREAGLLILIAAFGTFTVYGLINLIEVALTYGWHKCGQRMVYDLASDLYETIQRRSLAHDGEQALGDALNRLFGDSWSLYTIAHTLLMVPLQHLVTIGAITFVAWRIDAPLTLIAVGAVPVATVLAYLFAERLRRLARAEAGLVSEIMAFVQQTLSAIPLIQTFGARRQTQAIYRELADRSVRLAGRTALIDQAVIAVSTVTVAGATAAVLLVGGARVLSGSITLGVLVVFLAYLKTINSSVEACLTALAKIMAAHAGLRRVCEVFDEDAAIADAPSAVPYVKPEGRKAGRIAFEGVTFGYPGRAPILRGLDLDIAPGETVALVGPSGGGKSTLVSLIPRFFDPSAGRVMLDGQDIKFLTLSSLRTQISVVLQQPFLMPGSVADNIAYQPRAYGRDEIVAAAVASGAHEVIRALPEGYDTLIGEHGATLSGGQKQLIAIARALLKNAPVLILDEPTSALDVETEAKVMAGLRKLMAGRTTIIVAHRLSTIRSADRILFVQGGVVRELGSISEVEGHMLQGAT